MMQAHVLVSSATQHYLMVYTDFAQPGETIEFTVRYVEGDVLPGQANGLVVSAGIDRTLPSTPKATE